MALPLSSRCVGTIGVSSSSVHGGMEESTGLLGKRNTSVSSAQAGTESLAWPVGVSRIQVAVKSSTNAVRSLMTLILSSLALAMELSRSSKVDVDNDTGVGK
jgi:hypothetical protein